MRCSNCGVCCTETEMLLSKRDIKRLEKLGYLKKHFAHKDRHGYFTLKNREGYCVFYNREKHCCNVYLSRPSGCRVYPVIVDETQRIILDSICESRNTISEREKTLKGKIVVRLLEIIDSEAAKRHL